VYLDQHGIFHADCQSDEDCAMALGYFHARDRFVQMDLQRRLSTGRLANVVNKDLVETAGLLEPLINTATQSRALYSTRDGRPAEEALVDGTDERTLRMFQAYAVGVNRWLDDVRNGRNGAVWPAEFGSILLDYGPEDAPEWTPEDSFATVFTLVGSLTNDEGTQLRAEEARQAINDNDRYLDLWSLEPIKKSPVLAEGTYPPQLAAASVKKKANVDASTGPLHARAKEAIRRQRLHLEQTRLIRQLFPGSETTGEDIGSNNWVLGPTKTANDRTFLSNDPHLGLSQPAVWYIAHLDSKTNGSGTLRTAGVTLAGIPTPVIGHNENIAWGATNTGLDFTDLYIEELVKNGQGEPIGVRFNGETVEFIRKDFTLTFNDGSTVTREILYVPHHGPVRQLDAENDVCITLRWTGHDMDTDANYLMGMATATTVQEARAALESVTSLGQNWVVIDNQGNFGWFPYNRIPKRTWAQNLDMENPNEPFPWLPLPGTGEYEWTEYFAYSELPQTYNRENGYLVTANSDHTGTAFDGNPTNNGFAPQQTDNIAAGYRTARIVELIEATDEHTRATNEAAISDVLSMIGRDMVPNILAIANDDQTNLTENGQKIVNALTDWSFTCETGLDGNDPVNSPPASLAEVKESSGCTAWHEVLSDIDNRLARDESTKSFPSFVTYFSIMDTSRLKAGDVYWDDVRTPEVETKFDIIGAAFNEAGDNLVAEFGSDEAAWPWGRKHGFRLESLLAGLSDFFNVYNNPPGDEDFYANRGGRLTVDVANSGSSGIHGSGPSTRFQCEGSDPIQCTVQLPGGQSSHSDSDNYDDLLQLWLSRTPTELVFDIERAKNEAVQTFDLAEAQ